MLGHQSVSGGNPARVTVLSKNSGVSQPAIDVNFHWRLLHSGADANTPKSSRHCSHKRGELNSPTRSLARQAILRLYEKCCKIGHFFRPNAHEGTGQGVTVQLRKNGKAR
jgi:hypothetical protein